MDSRMISSNQIDGLLCAFPTPPIKLGHNHTIMTLHWTLVLSVETWSDTRAVYRYLPATCRFYFEFEHCTITVSEHVFGKLSRRFHIDHFADRDYTI